jgi:hypothetical protein
MIEVIMPLAFWRTRFHTLITSPASGVDDLAPMGLHCVDHRHLGTESRHDHHILRSQVVQIGIRRMRRQVANSKRLHLGVDIRVVDDFAKEKNPSVLENLPGRVGEVDGPLDPVAKAEFLREADRRMACLENTALGADFFHQFAAVVFFDLGMDMGHDIRRADVDSNT